MPRALYQTHMHRRLVAGLGLLLVVWIFSVAILAVQNAELEQRLQSEINARAAEQNQKLGELGQELQATSSGLNASIAGLKESQNRESIELRTQLRDLTELLDLARIASEVLDSVVHIETDSGSGAGIVLFENGTIVTNFHVVEGTGTIRVRLRAGNTTYQANLLGSDTVKDVALLKIEAGGLKPIRFGDSDQARVGDRVIAIGHPAKLDWTVTQGIISAKDRTLPIYTGGFLLQVDMPLNPGNSGGPIIDSAGKVVGLATAKVRTAEGLGFAIPISTVKDVLRAMNVTVR